MPLTIHEIDPDYDTLIVLTHPCRAFAPWDPSAEIAEYVVPEPRREPGAEIVVRLDDGEYGDEGGLPDPGKSKKKSKKKWKKMTKAPGRRDDDDASMGRESSSGGAVAEGSASSSDAQPVLTEVSHNADHVPSSDDADTPEIETPPADHEEDTVHYHVSSRHLTLASPWFKRTLTSSRSKEAVRDPTDGRFRVHASDWDEEAFLILLNIFHLRKRQIPKTVSVEMLAKIAVLVDYYELEKAEAIEDYVEIWTNHVRHSHAVPSSYGRELMLWMCVSAVFDMSAEFEKATDVAIRESRGSIQTLSLPIPPRATREIDDKRVRAIEHIISELHRLLEKYHSSDYSCPCPRSSDSFFCGAFLFGALYKEMERLGLLAPRPQKPFLGLSFRGLCSKADAIRNPVWHQQDRDPYYGSNRLVGHPCRLNVEIDRIVLDGTKIVDGLKLRDLKGGK